MFKKWALLALTESESFDIVFAAPKKITSGSVETNGPSLEESAELHNDKSQFQIDANSWGTREMERTIPQCERSKSSGAMTTDLADDVNIAALETLVLGELEQHLAMNRTRPLGKRPPREEERMKMWAGGRRKKKPEILGGPAEGGPAEVCPAEVGPAEVSPAVVLHSALVPRVPRQGSGKATRVAKVGPNRPKIRKAIGQSNAWPKLAQIGSTQQKTAQIGQFEVVAKIGKAVAKVGLAVAKQGRGQTRSWPNWVWPK